MDKNHRGGGGSSGCRNLPHRFSSAVCFYDPVELTTEFLPLPILAAPMAALSTNEDSAPPLVSQPTTSTILSSAYRHPSMPYIEPITTAVQDQRFFRNQSRFLEHNGPLRAREAVVGGIFKNRLF